VKYIENIIDEIEDRSKRRNKNFQQVGEMKNNYQSLKIMRNTENEMKHKQNISRVKRQDLSRKERLIEQILNKNEK